MRPVLHQPGASEFGVSVQGIRCPFCESSRVRFESMTGGSAAELLLRCLDCRSFFMTLKDTDLLGRSSCD